MKLLRIDSSARRSSVSRQLTTKFVDSWKEGNPNGQIIERDLATTQLPLITDEWTQAAYTPEANLTPSQKEVLSVSDTLIKETIEADVIVIGVPMYNFTIPAPLKGWIDHFAYPDLETWWMKARRTAEFDALEWHRTPVASSRRRGRGSRGS